MKYIFILILLISAIEVNAQKLYSKTAQIQFFSATPIEDIEAVSNSVATVFDLNSGKTHWSVLIKSFEFEKALMQEHFNENYMESYTFPKAIFKGQINNIDQYDFSSDGTFEVPITGAMNIHGVSNNIDCNLVFIVKNEKVSASTSFVVLIEDYGISVPAIVRDNIAKEITINVNVDYAPLD